MMTHPHERPSPEMCQQIRHISLLYLTRLNLPSCWFRDFREILLDWNDQDMRHPILVIPNFTFRNPWWTSTPLRELKVEVMTEGEIFSLNINHKWRQAGRQAGRAQSQPEMKLYFVFSGEVRRSQGKSWEVWGSHFPVTIGRATVESPFFCCEFTKRFDFLRFDKHNFILFIEAFLTLNKYRTVVYVVYVAYQGQKIQICLDV